MKRLFVTVLRGFLALVLLVPTVAFFRALLRLSGTLNQPHTAFLLGIGFGGGVVFFAVVRRSVPAYVFSHELTHWLAAKLFRRRTGRFRLKADRGSVDVERPNIWIVLSPYFVPLYTLLWLGGCGIASLLLKGPHVWLQRAAYAGLGLTYAFHVVLTVRCLRREQVDLARYGKLLSLSLILLVNVLLLYLFVVAFSGQWGRGLRLPASLLLEQLRWCANCLKPLLPVHG